MENEFRASLALVLLSFLVGAYAYTQLPDTIATHWGLSGEANGYMPRLPGVFLFPAILAVLLAVFAVLPLIDPLRANIEKSRTAYYGFILVITAFMFIVYIQTLLWNMGTMVSFALTLPIMLGGLFFCLGILLDKVKRNWFIGIRTPWTLSSDAVWDKTHKFGATVFKLAGIFMLLSLAKPEYTVPMVVALAIIAAAGVVVYSYVIYNKLAKKRTWKRGSRKTGKTKKE